MESSSVNRLVLAGLFAFSGQFRGIRAQSAATPTFDTASVYEYHDRPMFGILCFIVLAFFLGLFITALMDHFGKTPEQVAAYREAAAAAAEVAAAANARERAERRAAAARAAEEAARKRVAAKEEKLRNRRAAKEEAARKEAERKRVAAEAATARDAARAAAALAAGRARKEAAEAAARAKAGRKRIAAEAAAALKAERAAAAQAAQKARKEAADAAAREEAERKRLAAEKEANRKRIAAEAALAAEQAQKEAAEAAARETVERAAAAAKAAADARLVEEERQRAINRATEERHAAAIAAMDQKFADYMEGKAIAFHGHSWNIDDFEENREILTTIAEIMNDPEHKAISLKIHGVQKGETGYEGVQRFKSTFPRLYLSRQALSKKGKAYTAQGRVMACKDLLVELGVDVSRMMTSADIGDARQVQFIAVGRVPTGNSSARNSAKSSSSPAE